MLKTHDSTERRMKAMIVSDDSNAEEPGKIDSTKSQKAAAAADMIAR